MKLTTLFLILSFNLYAQETESLKKEKAKPKRCDFAQAIVDHIYNKEWKSLIPYLNFPLQKAYPQKPASRQEFEKDPLQFFSADMFGKSYEIQERKDNCLINKGLMWIDSDSKKIIKINYETEKAKQKRIAYTKDELKLAPTKWKESVVQLSCQMGKHTYNVYKNKGTYLLLISNDEKVVEKIDRGLFRVDDSGIRYFQFNQKDATVTMIDNIRKGGYYIKLSSPKSKKDVKFFNCLEANT